jgi:hypothetical protein
MGYSKNYNSLDPQLKEKSMAYRNLARIEAEDKELEELEAAYRKENGEISEDDAEVTPSNPPDDLSDEEKTWKKRHGDLRSYTSKQINDLTKKISDLEASLQEKDKESKFPMDKEEAEEWVKNYPDLARVIGTLVYERASDLVAPLSQEVKTAKLELEAERLAIARERAITDILKAHPDFLQLREEEDFKEWVESQPSKRGPRIGQALYDALYVNETDGAAAVEAINIYKQDRGITKRAKVTTSDDDARSVTHSRTATPKETSGKRQFLESEIEKMKPWEFDKLEDEIEQARREGRIVYDISGAAR